MFSNLCVYFKLKGDQYYYSRESMQQLESLQQQQHPHINGVFNQSMYSGDFKLIYHFNDVISNLLLRSEYKSTSTATIPTATAATNCKRIIHTIAFSKFISNIISFERGYHEANKDRLAWETQILVYSI